MFTLARTLASSVCLLVGFRKIRHEVEGFRDQDFVLQIYLKFEFRVLWLLKKPLPSREEADISSSSILTRYAQPEAW